MPRKTSVKNHKPLNPKAIFFDLDDTFLKTREIYQDEMVAMYRYLVAQYPDKTTEDEIKEIFESLNNAAFEKYGVDFSRWNYVLTHFQADLPHLSDDVIAHLREMIEEIHNTVPEIYEGTYEVLQYFTKNKKPIFLVTHSDYDWTWWKLKVTNLSAYFNEKNVYIVDPLKHKDANAWKEAISRFGYRPQEILVIGDSLRSDVGPALELGAEVIHVERPTTWIVQHKEVKGDFKTVESLLDIPKIFEGRKTI